MRSAPRRTSRSCAVRRTDDGHILVIDRTDTSCNGPFASVPAIEPPREGIEL